MNKKTVWIVGASSGIGRALALEYSKNANFIILTARREKELNELAAELSCPCAVFPADITKTDYHASLVREINQKHGSIHTLVLTPGVSQRATALETELSVDFKIMHLNYFSLISLTKEVVPGMIENGGGNVVVLSSVMGKYSSKLRSAYSASKHALHGFYNALRAETADKNMKYTLVCPGFVNTKISYNTLKGNGETFNKMAAAQAKGISPDKAAKKIVAAAEKGKREVAFGGVTEMLGLFLNRFFPGIFARAISRKNVT